MVDVKKLPEKIAQGVGKNLGRDFLLWLIEAITNINTKLDQILIATSGNFASFDASGQIEDSNKAKPTGDVVGTSDSQTLTNKTLDTPAIADLSNSNHDHEDGTGGGKLDHGDALDGKSDDDHAQYHTDARGDARYLYRENVGAFTPDADYEPSTKKYVDDKFASGWTGSFTNGDGDTVTVADGLITDVS